MDDYPNANRWFRAHTEIERLVAEIIKTGSEADRYEVAGHQNTPLSTLLRIRDNDPSERVRNRAKTTLAVFRGIP
jgi:hypothetical protein